MYLYTSICEVKKDDICKAVAKISSTANFTAAMFDLGVLLIEDRCRKNDLSDRELYDKYELLKSKVDKSIEDKISSKLLCYYNMIPF